MKLLRALKVRVKLRKQPDGSSAIEEIGFPELERIERPDWQSFDDILEAYEVASSEAVWDANIAFSASPVPGCRWHCETCRWHELTPTTLQRPTHCGEPMGLETVSWMANQFDASARSLAVALGLTEE